MPTAILLMTLLAAAAPQPPASLSDEVWKGGISGLESDLAAGTLPPQQREELLGTAAFGLNVEAVKLLLWSELSAEAKGAALHRAIAALRSHLPGAPAHEAWREERVRAIAGQLIASGAALETTERYGATVLSHAIYERADWLALLLLEGGAKPDAPAVWWGTPLCRAARNGAVEVVAALLARGAAVETAGRRDETALLAALAPERSPPVPGDRTLAVVQLLLDAGARVGGERLDSGLARAVRHETHAAQLVALLVERRPEAVRAQAPVALLVAAERGRTEAAKLLLPLVSDPDAEVDFEKRTALMIAAANGHAELVKALLARGADPGRKSRSGKSARQLADDERQVETLGLLLAREGKAPPAAGEGVDVLIWGGGKDAAAAGRWLASWQAEAADYRGLIELAEGYPKVEPSAALSGLNPGFQVVLLGACAPSETRRALTVLKALYPGVYARRVSAKIAPACPVVASWERTFLASVEAAGGALFSAAELRGAGGARSSRLFFSLRGRDGVRLDFRSEEGDTQQCEATLSPEAGAFRVHTVCELAPCEGGPDDVVTGYAAARGKIAVQEVSSARLRGPCDTGD